MALNLLNASSSLTTWGGSVVRDPTTGMYHMYASAMAGEDCGLDAWESNSMVLHAVSTGPTGPYSLSGVAVPVYAHNPQVVYSAKEKVYLLFVLGYKNDSAARECVAGSPIGPASYPEWITKVSLHRSRSPYGPWEPLGIVVSDSINANPTAWVDLDGEITLLYGRYVGAHQRVYSILTAKSSHNPWVRRGNLPASLNPPSSCSPDPHSPWHSCYCNNEDPFLYKQQGQWHILFHQYTLSSAPHNKSETCQAMQDPEAGPDPSMAVVGGHAVSRNNDVMGEWNYDYWEAAYGMEVKWADSGYPGVITRRERPKLLFDPETGTPTHLFNGVCLADGKPDPGSRNCFTLVDRIL